VRQIGDHAVTINNTLPAEPAPPPPPPQIGLQVTGAEANAQAGINTRTLVQTLQNLDNIRLWSEQFSAEELENLGLTTGTGASYKSAMAEVPSVLAALEATQFLKKLGGMGV
jgi:hypothetical protein